MALTQQELKREVARAALAYVEEGRILGVGTGSTVDQFIDQLPGIREKDPRLRLLERALHEAS